MLIFIAVLFMLAMVFGAIIATAILKNKPTPKPIVLFHGTLAILALIVMASVIIAGHTSTLLLTSLILFLITAMGGLTMLVYDMKGKPIPRLFVLFHPTLAIIALITLILAIFQATAVS